MPDRMVKEDRQASVMLLIRGLFQALNFLRKKLLCDRTITMESYIFKIARVTGNSEFDVFCKSAESWPISHERIERDFRAYLLQQSVPYYVSDFVRKNKKHIDELHIPLF